MGKNFKKFDKLIFGGAAVVSTVFSNAGVGAANAMENFSLLAAPHSGFSETEGLEFVEGIGNVMNLFDIANCPPQDMSSNFLETDAFKIFLENVDEKLMEKWEKDTYKGKTFWEDFSEVEGNSKTVEALKQKKIMNLVSLYALAKKHLDKKDKVYKKATALKKDLEKVFSDSENMKSKILDFFAKSTDEEINSLLSKKLENGKFFIFKDYLSFLGVPKQDPVFVKVYNSEIVAKASHDILNLRVGLEKNELNKNSESDRKDAFLTFLKFFKKILTFVYSPIEGVQFNPQQWRKLVIDTICGVGESIENQPAIKKITEYLRKGNYSENIERFVEKFMENLIDIHLDVDHTQNLFIANLDYEGIPENMTALGYTGTEYVCECWLKK